MFGKNFFRLDDSESDEVPLTLGHLLARLVVNTRSGLSPPEREKAIKHCVKTQIRFPTNPWMPQSNIFTDLIGDDVQWNRKVLKEIGAQIEVAESRTRRLDLSGTQVSDITPLANLHSLESLDLGGTQVSDITPLANLTSLKSLDLKDTHVAADAVDGLRRSRPNIRTTFAIEHADG